MKTLSFAELVDREARELALRALESRLSAANLPLPKDSSLKIHIDAMLRANPQLAQNALDRVMAQQDAYSESLRAIGLKVPDLPLPIEISLEGELE